MRPVPVQTLYFGGNANGLPPCLCKSSSMHTTAKPGEAGLYAEYWPWDREFYIEFCQGTEIKVFMLPRESVRTWEPVGGRAVRDLMTPAAPKTPKG